MRTNCFFSTDAYARMYQKEEGTAPLSNVHAVAIAFFHIAYIYIFGSGSASKKGIICSRCRHFSHTLPDREARFLKARHAPVDSDLWAEISGSIVKDSALATRVEVPSPGPPYFPLSIRIRCLGPLRTCSLPHVIPLSVLRRMAQIWRQI